MENENAKSVDIPDDEFFRKMAIKLVTVENPELVTHAAGEKNAQNSYGNSDVGDAEQRLASIRGVYAEELKESWQDLFLAVLIVYEENNNIDKREEAVQVAHRIRGTAGSVGFTKVSEYAGRIEDLLLELKQNNALRSEQWDEVIDVLPAGANCITEAIQSLRHTGKPRVVTAGSSGQ
jgi:HPt (histidine-containing phosphotransfer) domain-containing protein